MPEAGADGVQRLWRVSNHVSLDGTGGLRDSARWHTQGRRIVYLAESPAGAVLEALVHLEIDLADPPAHFTVLMVEAPRSLGAEKAVQASAADGLDQTREIGDRWLQRGKSVLLRVPSLLLPETFNVLFNPAHAEAAQVKLAAHTAYPWDRRLLRVR